MSNYTIPFENLKLTDVEVVGGKNASIGEMIGQLARLGVKVPGGFATTAQAYRDFLAQDGLDERIRAPSPNSTSTTSRSSPSPARASARWILATPFQAATAEQIVAGGDYRRMDAGRDIAVAVRSSATAEDLPEASFAGQQETFLNVRGRDAVLRAVHDVYASLFNDRAIAYRVHQGFDHSLVALSAGVQYMVRSDLGASGVMFTLDTEFRLPRRGVHHGLLRPRRDRRAGRGESRRVLRLQARAACRPQVDPAPQPRRQGHQDDLRGRCLRRARADRRRAASRSPALLHQRRGTSSNSRGRRW